MAGILNTSTPHYNILLHIPLTEDTTWCHPDVFDYSTLQPSKSGQVSGILRVVEVQIVISCEFSLHTNFELVIDIEINIDKGLVENGTQIFNRIAHSRGRAS